MSILISVICTYTGLCLLTKELHIALNQCQLGLFCMEFLYQNAKWPIKTKVRWFLLNFHCRSKLNIKQISLCVSGPACIFHCRVVLCCCRALASTISAVMLADMTFLTGSWKCSLDQSPQLPLFKNWMSLPATVEVCPFDLLFSLHPEKGHWRLDSVCCKRRLSWVVREDKRKCLPPLKLLFALGSSGNPWSE